MFGDRDLITLIEYAGVCRLQNGWQVVVRAEWVDRTVNRPHSLSYALILQDHLQNRLLGFDNSHLYDGADSHQPFDHEHRIGELGRRFRYDFVTTGQLISDFIDRCLACCKQFEIEFMFDDERCQR